MEKFKLVSKFKPAGDQVRAIKKIIKNIKDNKKHQVLLGATGTGKTFTISNVINKVQKTTLVLAHNKTLAAQLYGEFKKYFPDNRVEYFISYFDYYQPEAYVASSDTYIDKSSQVNSDIELMRLSTLNSLQNRKDTIVVASVACIYAQNNPDYYRAMTFDVRVGDTIKKNDLLRFLTMRGYARNDIDSHPATFKAKGDVIEICPGWTDKSFIRIDFFGDVIDSISLVEPITKKKIKDLELTKIFPADGFVSSKETIDLAVKEIEKDLEARLKFFKKEKKLIEYERLENRIRSDIADLKEFGYCGGIENYSRYLDGRKPGETPFSLFNYLPDDYLLVVDESHQMLPQIRGMFAGDKSRKENLVEYGFRLPSALENRPLRFEEFSQRYKQAIFVSATPGDYELDLTQGEVVEQIIRPTGLIDPEITIVPIENQIDYIIKVYKATKKRKERLMITTLTKKMAEDISEYLKENNIKATYLHSDIKTLERAVIINDFRRGRYDVLIGINLLREGLDIPEVSTICILDADKEGFLRSSRSLIQIIGRAARNKNGHVYMFANRMTESMSKALQETKRRRDKQIKYNEDNNITPQTIIKEIDDALKNRIIPSLSKKAQNITKIKKSEREKVIQEIRIQMKTAAKNMEFETAAYLRDLILEIKKQ